MFIEVFEGRYWSHALGKKVYYKFGVNTVGTLMRMVVSIFGSGIVVVSDSGFCCCLKVLVG